MPKKSVWNMSDFERMHYSIRGKTLRSTILFVLILSIAAISFGFYLYTATINREYRKLTFHLSNMAAAVIDIEEVQKEAAAVLDIFDSIPENEKGDGRDNIERFMSVRTPAFERMRKLLMDMRIRGEAITAYTAAMDPEHHRQIFIADSDTSDTFCPPGSFDIIEEDTFAGLMRGYSDDMDSLYGTPKLTSVLSDTEQYGYRCMAGKKLFAHGKYVVYIFFETDMNEVAKLSRTFFTQYCLIVLILDVLVVALSERALERGVVAPINELADAAKAYYEDSIQDRREGQYFSRLDIHTGDEIENLSLTMKAMESELSDYVERVSRDSAERERIGTELNLAMRIQSSMLPHVFPPFPDVSVFDIYASMEAAKEVGGDFYDFFMIDSDHLGLVMADVSGKGIPAALFMMISKILIKTRAQSGLSPAQILKAVNEQICSNNREDMFVTVWLGVLELSTGRLTASNAGHEYPIISSEDGSFELFRDRHGFVIGGMSSSKYTDYTIDLAPGSCIFLYTDGVMEAANREGERFGSDRLIKVLNSNSEKTPKEIIDAVSIAADNFSMDTDQFDDITMLCLRYNGESGIRFDSSLNIEAETDFQPRVMDFIDEKLESYGVGMKDASRIKIASDELFSNVSKFAYRGMEKGDIKVEIGRSDDHRSVFLRFSDSGAPFDPLKGKTPDTTLSADDREIGGLGIFLTRKLMDDVKYEYRNGMNTVTIRKDIDI